ncbi:TPM domain-containing protein [Desulfovibrio sp. OttesenSCG-928-A18]|nr:TPM domain-containing protein [Desulfovibrio sp. OttesenSCG-928-A18]
MQRFFRILIIGLLFCAVIWGFWMNNERQMERLRKESIPALDSTGLLREEEQQRLAQYVERFRKNYGLAIVISIRDQPFPSPFLLPDERAGSFFFGLCPPDQQVLFEVPPLAEHLLGQPFISYLRHEHFRPYFARGNWPEGLASALSMLAERMDKAVAPDNRKHTEP